jgi:hypothetical protein
MYQNCGFQLVFQIEVFLPVGIPDPIAFQPLPSRLFTLFKTVILNHYLFCLPFQPIPSCLRSADELYDASPLQVGNVALGGHGNDTPLFDYIRHLDVISSRQLFQ